MLQNISFIFLFLFFSDLLQTRDGVKSGEGFHRLVSFFCFSFESVFRIESGKTLWELGPYFVLITNHLVL